MSFLFSEDSIPFNEIASPFIPLLSSSFLTRVLQRRQTNVLERLIQEALECNKGGSQKLSKWATCPLALWEEREMSTHHFEFSQEEKKTCIGTWSPMGHQTDRQHPFSPSFVTLLLWDPSES